MATYGQDTCIFIPADAGFDKEARHLDWLFDSIIAPVMDEHFPKFDLTRELGVRRNEVTEHSLISVITAELLIADVTRSPSEVMFQLGVRHSSGRPTIVMREPDTQPWLEASRARTVLYVPFGPTEDIRERLRIAIEEVLADPIFDDPYSDYLSVAADAQPEARRVGKRGELSERIRSIATAISDLRLNSTQEHVEELRRISGELEGDKESTKDVPEAAEKALKVLIRLLDVLGTKRGGEIILAGSVAGLLSIGGWQAVSVYALTLASLKGKDAFLKALQTLKRK